MQHFVSGKFVLVLLLSNHVLVIFECYACSDLIRYFKTGLRKFVFKSHKG